VTVAGSASVEVAEDVFTCVLGASEPGLPTRIDTLRFVGATCVDVEVADGPAPAAASVPAGGSLAATAVAEEVLRWSTGPLSPGLSTRTVTLRFVGWTCVEPAVAVAESLEVVPEGVGVEAVVGNAVVPLVAESLEDSGLVASVADAPGVAPAPPETETPPVGAALELDAVGDAVPVVSGAVVVDESCAVVLPAAPSADAFESLFWETGPFAPGCPTRTLTLTFCGSFCVELAEPFAFPVWSALA
jgi:hypothetical protein